MHQNNEANKCISSFSTCFFTLDDANARNKLLKAINSSQGAGGYMCQLHDVVLSRYIMQLTDNFRAESIQNARGQQAAKFHGKNGNLWMLNEEVLVDKHGNQLEGTTDLVWLGKYITRPCVVPDKYASQITTPLSPAGLDGVLRRLQKCLGKRN